MGEDRAMVAQFEEIEIRMSDLSDLVERLRGHSRPGAEFETKDFVAIVEAGLNTAADEFRGRRRLLPRQHANGSRRRDGECRLG
jgi:hypothetical protein